MINIILFSLQLLHFPQNNLKTMDFTSHRQLSSLFDSSHVHGVELGLEGNPRFQRRSSGNPFEDSFQDPLCRLNLKETSEFVRSFPERGHGVSSVVQRRLEGPPTPGRPFFSFSVGRKSFPSKWDDAEKWLIGSDSPAHVSKIPKQSETFREHQVEVFRFSEKNRTNVAVSTAVSFNGASDVPLKDKFTNDAEPMPPISRHSEPFKEAMKDASTGMVHHRDAGTEMTPLGSSTASLCHTPFKSSSPARHTTPADRSGPLAMDTNISQLETCHLAKLQLGTLHNSVTSSNWSSKEEEEEEVSKSLRHTETDNECHRNASESTSEKTKCCIGYQREEAHIQAWVNLQRAKAEAKSKKLEVKIQKMRSNLEEKLMKRMSDVHKKAEEWRISAQEHHRDQIQAQKMMKWQKSTLPGHRSCGCFP